MGLLKSILKLGKGTSRAVASDAKFRKVLSFDALGSHPSGAVYARVNKSRITPGKTKSIPLSQFDGMPEGGAGARSRHVNNPSALGVGPDKGFGSGKLGILAELGGKIARMAGFGEDAGKMLTGIEKAFPGIKSMSKTEFLETLQAGRFTTKYADDMGGEISQTALKNIRNYMAKGGKVEGGKLMEGMHEVHLPRSGIDYETKAYTYIRDGRVQTGGYMQKKGAGDPWIRAGLYNSSTAPKSVEGYSIAKVISAKMAHAGGYAPSSLSKPGAKSFYDVYHSVLEHMQTSTSVVKANTTGFTQPGLATIPGRGGSRMGPIGGT